MNDRPGVDDAGQASDFEAWQDPLASEESYDWGEPWTYAYHRPCPRCGVIDQGKVIWMEHGGITEVWCGHCVKEWHRLGDGTLVPDIHGTARVRACRRVEAFFRQCSDDDIPMDVALLHGPPWENPRSPPVLGHRRRRVAQAAERKGRTRVLDPRGALPVAQRGGHGRELRRAHPPAPSMRVGRSSPCGSRRNASNRLERSSMARCRCQGMTVGTCGSH